MLQNGIPLYLVLWSWVAVGYRPLSCRLSFLVDPFKYTLDLNCLECGLVGRGLCHFTGLLASKEFKGEKNISKKSGKVSRFQNCEYLLSTLMFFVFVFFVFVFLFSFLTPFLIQYLYTTCIIIPQKIVSKVVIQIPVQHQNIACHILV